MLRFKLKSLKQQSKPDISVHRSRDANLGVPELIAIALGGMVGGGIFTILGVSVAMVGVFTPLAIFLGGVIASFAAYSYIKLGVYYQDEGATYAFFKRTFPSSRFFASLIGWSIIFGYVSTIALYAYTFASYAISAFSFADSEMARKLVAGMVILVFTLINIWSVKGMGKVEDLMVYTKLLILVVISFVLVNRSQTTLPVLFEANGDTSLLSVLMVASITFVAYEGFQLVINAVNEMDEPQVNIPRAIYAAVFLATTIYVVIAVGAILAIPFEDIVANKEYALASGAEHLLGPLGSELVIAGALLATSSAISGTVFGASRQMAVIARDGYFPAFLKRRSRNIPVYAIVTMASLAFLLVIAGNLQLILEFGSITFLLVSVLMSYANYRIRDLTGSSRLVTIFAMLALIAGTVLIFYYELLNQPEQLLFMACIYVLLTAGALLYSYRKSSQEKKCS